MSSIKVYGIAIFNLRKDPDVALLDLQVAGVRNLVNEELDDQYTKLLLMAEKEFPKLLPKKCTTNDYIGEVNRRQVLIRFYIDEEGKVIKALILALRSGTLRPLVRRLEKLGWTRALLFEIRKVIHKASADY